MCGWHKGCPDIDGGGLLYCRGRHAQTTQCPPSRLALSREAIPRSMQHGRWQASRMSDSPFLKPQFGCYGMKIGILWSRSKQELGCTVSTVDAAATATVGLSIGILHVSRGGLPCQKQAPNSCASLTTPSSWDHVTKKEASSAPRMRSPPRSLPLPSPGRFGELT